MTVIVDVERRDRDLVSRIQAVQAGVASVGAQVIVSCEEPWDDAPAGVDVVVFPSNGRGDRHDAASRLAQGELLAFIDGRVTFSPDWASEVLRVFQDPSVVIAGGPVLPQGRRRRERISALVMTHYLGGTPAAHNARCGPSRTVREVGSSNLIIRTAAFRAVGGFQAPARGGGEAVRLCYKVRTLLGGKITSEPGLALSASAPCFPRALLRDIAIYGRSRGDMARRLPEATSLLPYALPSLISLLFCLSAGLLVVAGRGTGRGTILASLFAVLGVLIVFVAIQATRTLRGNDLLGDRILAGLAVPVVVFVFGVTFVRGYFGRSMEDISPPRNQVSPLRVLILNWRDVTHPWSGGAETYMHEIARRWAADGMDVAWLTQRHAGSARHDVIDRIHFHRVGGRLTLYPRAALTYVTRLRGRYDVIVDCENGIPFFSPCYSRIPKVLVVFHVHQEVFRKQVPRQFRWLALWLEGTLMPRMYRHVSVVTISDGTRSDLVDLGFDSTHINIVKCGVVPPEMIRSARSIDPSILCMGRLKPQKSVDVLIRAMPAIIEHIPSLHVDVVGQGPDRARLERLAWSTGMAGHVRFHGYVNAKVRDEIADSAWLAVCPSAFEGWGVVCMEASARGLPVVASDVAGLRESVLDGETGILVPYADQSALVDAVVALLRDPERRARMGTAGKMWAARHTWDDSAQAFAALLSAQVTPRPLRPDSKPELTLASWR